MPAQKSPVKSDKHKCRLRKMGMNIKGKKNPKNKLRHSRKTAVNARSKQAATREHTDGLSGFLEDDGESSECEDGKDTGGLDLEACAGGLGGGGRSSASSSGGC